jgi:hypothetical protein
MLKQYREIVRDLKVRLEISSVVNFRNVIRNTGGRPDSSDELPNG